MTRTSRSWALALAVAPALAGCAAGFDATTTRPYAPTEARVTSVNGIRVAQAYLLGPEPGERLAAGSSAPIYLVMVNTNAQPDSLNAATAEGVGTVRFTSPVRLPPRQPVRTVSGQGTSASSTVIVQNLAKPLSGGEHVTVNLQFANAGVVPVSVPVVPRTREFATVPPAPTAGTPTAEPSVTPTPTATPTEAPVTQPPEE